MRVAFLGLGNMGSGMARRRPAAGHSLAVYNRTAARAAPFAAHVARGRWRGCRRQPAGRTGHRRKMAGIWAWAMSAEVIVIGTMSREMP
ncbi:MAG: NAD(P)-binding domain-containing protein [bacterium]